MVIALPRRLLDANQRHKSMISVKGSQTLKDFSPGKICFYPNGGCGHKHGGATNLEQLAKSIEFGQFGPSGQSDRPPPSEGEVGGHSLVF